VPKAKGEKSQCHCQGHRAAEMTSTIKPATVETAAETLPKTPLKISAKTPPNTQKVKT
jgi:hypothetical protein